MCWTRKDYHGVVKLATALVVISTAIYGAVQAENDIPEYCQWEVFNASCDHGEIIVMTHAQYGRMRLGRCLTTDVYIGCGADVLSEMDAKCSGKQTCELKLPDSSLHKQQPCPSDMMAYLEASYTCVKVGSLPKGHQCSSILDPDPQTNLTGVLSSAVGRATGYGMPGCGWRVGVKPGQQIRVSLVDFGLATRYQSETFSSVSDDREYCYVYAMISESREGKEFTVCAGTRRESVVYVSASNLIEIVLLDGNDNSQNFVFKYEAIGCPDISPPTNAFVMRQGDEGVTITCNSSSQAWHLVCKGTEWVGEYGECTAGAAAPPPGDDPLMPSYGLVLAILIGVAIGVMVGFTLLAGVLWCRRRRRDKRVPENTEENLNNRVNTLQLAATSPGTPACKVHRLKGEYGYTHVWEVQGSPGHQVYRPAAGGAVTPDSAYQSYQSHQAPGDTRVCFHPKKDHDYESPRFESFGLNMGREALIQRPLYQGCGGKTCPTMKPHHKPAQCGDSLDSVVHIEVGVESAPVRGGSTTAGQTPTCYSMAGDAKPAGDVANTGVHDGGPDPKGNHYT